MDNKLPDPSKLDKVQTDIGKPITRTMPDYTKEEWEIFQKGVEAGKRSVMHDMGGYISVGKAILGALDERYKQHEEDY